MSAPRQALVASSILVALLLATAASMALADDSGYADDPGRIDAIQVYTAAVDMNNCCGCHTQIC